MNSGIRTDPFALREGAGDDPLIFVGEGGSVIPNRQGIPLRPREARVKVFANDGTQVARFGANLPGFGPDQFLGLHSIAVDSHGDVYVAEVVAAWIGTARRTTPVRGMAIAPEMATRRQLTRVPQPDGYFDRFAAKRPETRAWSPVRNGAD